jgi:predicted double-glycine peptidase
MLARTILLLGLFAISGCASVAEVDYDMPATALIGSNRFRKPVDDWQAQRERNVVMQDLDYSCGAAALATLFQYYWQDDIYEDEIIVAIFENLGADEIADREENGLSMTDLKDAAVELGYFAAMRRVELEDLFELKVPVVVRLVIDDYEHFVVFRGVVGDRVFLADPSRGNVRLSINQFARQWNNVLLVVADPSGQIPESTPLSVDPGWVIQNETLRPGRFLVRPR